jgi:lipopolysaccharide/colanic/teichoic acid biosynthesis glycosyltransferase
MKKITVTCHVYPEDSERGSPDKTIIDSRMYPDLSRGIAGRGGPFFKRSIDIVGSVICIFLFLPFFLIIPVLIKMTSRGSIFFRQERTGMFGRQFTFFKFRTMHVEGMESIHKEYVKNFIKRGSGTDNKQEVKKKLYKMENDPRVTPIGNFLRKTSLDEIPQFFNVLKGDMSLVGPRPPIFYELEHYDTWHRQRILHVKPGITGIWQVEGRSLVDFDDMVRMDLKYVREWSILLDIKILLKTPMAVLSLKGAY